MSCRYQQMSYDVPLFKVLTCSFCYVYMFKPDATQLRLDFTRSGPVLKASESSDFKYSYPSGSVYRADLDNSSMVTQICEPLSKSECEKWTTCCQTATKCCLRQQNLPIASQNWTHCPRTWDGFGCFDDTSAGSTAYIKCPSYIEHASDEDTVFRYLASYERNKTPKNTFYRPVSYRDFLEKPSTDLTKLQENWKKEATIFEEFPYTKKFLTIGIPTVRREGDEYIMDTINSIHNCAKPEELKDIYIVIFLADFNETWKKDISKRINESYPHLISSGTLLLIQSWESFYPPLNNLKNTYNHTYARRKWRSKQNVDYAFLFLYCKLLSTYYIQIEDDIYTVPGYIKDIRNYIVNAKSQWTCIEFSELGFIGKLYHSYDLEKLAKMVLLFYEEQPCDFTYLYFNIQMLQFKRIIRRPSIFQHVGLKSSLPGKIQSLKDMFFDNSEKSYKGNNPSAKLYTNLNEHEDHFFSPESSYSGDPGYFWSKGNGKKGDWLTIVFDKLHVVEKIFIIFIETGSREHPDDKIQHGKLYAGAHLINVEDLHQNCSNDIFLEDFENGNIKVENLTSTLGHLKIKCISIILTENQKWWIIIKEIAVFVAQ